MSHHADREAVAGTMARINQAWLAGRIDDLRPMIHPAVVMMLPGFSGRTHGRDQFLEGFRQFYQTATIHDFRETETAVDVSSNSAVVTFRFEMVYERKRERFRATGRDFWVFEREATAWVAVWRTMFDLEENPSS
jgi:hypothetical protein